jgi:hypothetical protein
MRPSKVMAKALSAAFHLMTHRARPRPVGSSDLVTRYRHLRAAACSWFRGRRRDRQMTCPPLTEIRWPVMKPAAGEARCATIAATSSGVPIRRSGTSAT